MFWTELPPSDCVLCSGTLAGTLSGNQVAVTVTSNAAATADPIDTADLPSNITIAFDCEQCDAETECVWFHPQIEEWRASGCTAAFNESRSEVTCSCDHLTTFALLRHEATAEEDEYVPLEPQNEWKYAHWTSCALFSMICVYVSYELHPFCRNSKLNWKQRPVYAMALVGVTAALYLLAALLLFDPDIPDQAVALLLILPHLCYLAIASLLLFTWFALAHSFRVDIRRSRDKLKSHLIAINVVAAAFFLGLYVLILIDADPIIFTVASIVWSVTTAAFAVMGMFYGVLSAVVLYRTTKNAGSASTDWQLVFKLISINAIISLYFLLESIIVIYYALNVEDTDNIVTHRIIELLSNSVCLVAIALLYRGGVKRLTKRRKLSFSKKKSKTSANADARLSSATASTLPRVSDAQKKGSSKDRSFDVLVTPPSIQISDVKVTEAYSEEVSRNDDNFNITATGTRESVDNPNSFLNLHSKSSSQRPS